MFQSDSSGFVASGDGIFIPPSALGGFIAAEMSATVPFAERFGKFVYAFAKGLALYREANADIVGLNVVRTDAVDDARYGVKTKNFAVTFQRYIDDRTGLIQFPAAAPAGSRAGLADFAFTDIFPGAVKVASGSTTSGPGVLILTSAIAADSALEHATISLSGDGRELVRAICSAIFSNRVLRSIETASALTAAGYGNALASIVPALWYAALNPSTALTSADVQFCQVISRTFTYSIEILEDELSQTFDVNTIVTPA